MKEKQKLPRTEQNLQKEQSAKTRHLTSTTRNVTTWEDQYRLFEEAVSSPEIEKISRQEACGFIPTLSESGKDFRKEDFLELYRDYLQENFEDVEEFVTASIKLPDETPDDTGDLGEKSGGDPLEKIFSNVRHGILGGRNPSEFYKFKKDMYSSNPLPKLAEGSEALINDDQIKSGKLSREFMAQALLDVLNQKGLSVRKAAEVAGVSPNTITTIKNKTAKIDTSLSVLEALGCSITCAVDPSPKTP